MARSRAPLYTVRVDIYEAATNYAYPIVTHLFTGRTRKEAWSYHKAHLATDSFLRQCEQRGIFDENVRCKTRVTEGWQ